MKIEDRRGDSLPEATVTLDDGELMELLQGVADVIEGKREHLHLSQMGGPQLVLRRTEEAEADPLQRSMDWWVGPLVLTGVLFLVIGGVTFVRWAIGLLS